MQDVSRLFPKVLCLVLMAHTACAEAAAGTRKTKSFIDIHLVRKDAAPVPCRKMFAFITKDDRGSKGFFPLLPLPHCTAVCRIVVSHSGGQGVELFPPLPLDMSF